HIITNMNEEQNKKLSQDAQIEALLFYKGEPIKKKELANILQLTEDDMQKALQKLRDRISLGGLTLIEHGEKISLGTHPLASPLIEKVTKDEITKDLGKAGLETLSVILYKGPVSRREIDYIRGVNS